MREQLFNQPYRQEPDGDSFVDRCGKVRNYTMEDHFQLVSSYQPTGDQPEAIAELTKGVLRGGGDTKMLMLADNLFLWVVSIPLGMLAGFVFHFPAFWIYVCLKADQILKSVWCVFRLRSGKWMKKITVGKVSGQEDRA